MGSEMCIRDRYKSFKSDVANLPPSKGTSGLNSGGITGTDVKIIHSGLLPEATKDSTNFNLLIRFLNYFALLEDLNLLIGL